MLDKVGSLPRQMISSLSTPSTTALSGTGILASARMYSSRSESMSQAEKMAIGLGSRESFAANAAASRGSDQVGGITSVWTSRLFSLAQVLNPTSRPLDHFVSGASVAKTSEPKEPRFERWRKACRPISSSSSLRNSARGGRCVGRLS